VLKPQPVCHCPVMLYVPFTSRCNHHVQIIFRCSTSTIDRPELIDMTEDQRTCNGHAMDMHAMDMHAWTIKTGTLYAHRDCMVPVVCTGCMGPAICMGRTYMCVIDDDRQCRRQISSAVGCSRCRKFQCIQHDVRICSD